MYTEILVGLAFVAALITCWALCAIGDNNPGALLIVNNVPPMDWSNLITGALFLAGLIIIIKNVKK